MFIATLQQSVGRLSIQSLRSAVNEGITLLDLPDEILLQIFYQSSESALAQVCRGLYQSLPTFDEYAMILVAAAFASKETFDLLTGKPGCSHISAIYNGQRTAGRHEQLQRQVGSSNWLTQPILERVYQVLFSHNYNDKYYPTPASHSTTTSEPESPSSTTPPK